MLLLLMVAAGAVAAQPPAPAVPMTADETLENYLGDRSLWDVMAAHLRRRLNQGTQEDRLHAAELLGKLYVKMLGEASDPSRRQSIEEASRELLRSVPESESFELRINLAKATYLQVEETVERDRLRIARGEDKVEAARVLRQVSQSFGDLASKLDSRVRQLERRETTAGEDDIEAVRADLAESRRLRSLTRYYAGWAAYYTALLENQPAKAKDALEHFGVLLNAVAGKPASVERAPKNLLRYEHVARAVVGCAMACSLLGSHEEAQRWLDLVELADQLPPQVKDQLLSRQFIVLAAAQRWSDIEVAVRRTTAGNEETPGRPLTVAEARLLSVLALEAARDPSQRPLLKGVAERVAQMGLADLVARGEIGHVTDLVTRYGTAPIGDSGFIAAYVRGVQAYEKARTAHQAAVKGTKLSADEPTTDNAVINLYREAAGVLTGATGEVEAERFGEQKARAGILRGLSMFYAGDLVSAAQQFEEAAASAKQDKQKQDALWYAIVALDRAIEKGTPSAIASRDRLAMLYLKSFPTSENAARLLLRQTRADKLSDKDALDILLKVPEESPLFFSARRQAARLLYQIFRGAPSSERDFAAIRFADLAEQVLKLEQGRALAGRDETAKEAAQAVVTRVRQIADALLSITTPDVARVESAMEVLDGVAAYHAIDLSQMEPELNYRRLQLAVAKGDEGAVRRTADQLRVAGGPFGAAADRLLYRRAQRVFKNLPGDTKLAFDVVLFGTRVLESVPEASPDPASVSLRDNVAEAAIVLWRAEHDTRMRDLAIKLDQQQLAAGKRTATTLRRLAELLEVTGDSKGALEAWQELLLGIQQGTPQWFEARYESLRLLGAASPTDAITAMQQHKVFYPEYGPEPWGPKLRDLDASLKSVPPAPATVPNNPPAPPANGGGK